MSDPFLGVTASLSGRRWVGPSGETLRRAAGLAQATGLPEAVTLVLARANVTAEDADAYLDPKLRDLMPDPSVLRDMDRAVEVIGAHLKRGSRIAVFADYDVDGATSAALLHDWLSALGVTPTLYVPDRIDEGYGPNTPAMEALAADHPLIICVDCGTLSHEPIASAVARGAEVIVLDHHMGGETLPDAAAVVNPNRQDEDGAFGHLCAAGVVFLTLVALNRQRRADGLACPDLMGMLDLVALGTVADVAPLIGLNRAFVRQGLTVMARRHRPGLVALADAAKLTSAPAPYHLGYMLGPRINAGGRVGRADLGTRLLVTRDPGQAGQIAAELDLLNVERRAIEAEVLHAAKAQAEARGTDGALVWAAGETWHPGVVGIVAARLKEAFNRPAVVIGLEGNEGKGSARSISGVDLGAAIALLASEGLLLKGGGHKMAAGLTVARDTLEAAMDRLDALLARQGADTAGVADLHVDALVSPSGATADLVESLERAGPFGAAAPQPRFALADARVAFHKRVGENHMALTLSDGVHKLSAIAFGAYDSPLAPAIEGLSGQPIHLAGRLELDDWGGRRKAKLRIEDAALPG
ncbi:single-stranded-DNA-specific exonuclease RecJ [Oceanibium sediminis]|uniref:single-stranded-DNA-specific exonuclease RecJ n=1 Tax=Oceanibium sediminis TaxID=2026339 RepID=UPI000DD3F302|nr:single-stranded-DNA-specific exonuclease RecJ [Oceanibium sediminis]